MYWTPDLLKSFSGQASISGHRHDHLLCCGNPGATDSVFLKWKEVGGHLRERIGKMSDKIPDPMTLNLPEPVPQQTLLLWCSFLLYI